ncbi:MAG: hypothetical protein AAB262_02360 [Elusimicrobiota bacterium]
MLRLYGIAARTVSERPDALGRVGDTLVAVTRTLVPPDSSAAEGCHRLWTLFVRYAGSPKVSLRQEAARAFYRDLEALAQRMDAPPLPSWERLPFGVDDPRAVQQAASDERPPALPQLRRRVASWAAEHADAERLAPQEVATLMEALDADAQLDALAELLRLGVIDRSEGQMLARWLRQRQPLGPDDEVVTETLTRIGEHLLA